MADELPPLTLQPLVENSILHAVAPRKGGGRDHQRAPQRAQPRPGPGRGRRRPGCDPEALAPPGQRRGVGLALKKRFALDYGQARLHPHGPGAGFRVDLFIPQT
jgi:hypothetical protein